MYTRSDDVYVIVHVFGRCWNLGNLSIASLGQYQKRTRPSRSVAASVLCMTTSVFIRITILFCIFCIFLHFLFLSYCIVCHRSHDLLCLLNLQSSHYHRSQSLKLRHLIKSDHSQGLDGYRQKATLRSCSDNGGIELVYLSTFVLLINWWSCRVDGNWT